MASNKNRKGVSYDTSWKTVDGEYVHYFKSGGWSFSSREDEDASVEHARDAVQAWKAWYKFLKSGKLKKDVKKLEKKLYKQTKKNKKTS